MKVPLRCIWACLLAVVPATSASANLSFNYSYTDPILPHSAYPDASGTDLSDGIYGAAGAQIGDTISFLDADSPSFVGTLNLDGGTTSQPEVTLDFGAMEALSNLQIVYGVDEKSNIFAPASVEISFSNDGSIFSGNSTFASFTGSGGSPPGFNHAVIFSDIVPLGDVQARYLRLNFTGGNQWVFLTELVVNPIPEPATVLLFGLGSCGMVTFVRRRLRA